MSHKWFVQVAERVEGPMSTEQVQNALTSGQLSVSALIWGRGLDQWHRLDWWSRELQNLTLAPVAPAQMEAWHFAYQNQSHGPMPRATLIAQVKDLPSPGEVMVWTKGMQEWAPLYEFHDLLSDIGLSRRQYPRADLVGKVTLKGNGTTLSAALLTISEGGFGIQLSGGLVAGQIMSVELTSNAFRDTIHARAECRYVSQGVVGMKFTHVSSENKGAIIQYVRQSQTRFALKAS